MAVVSILTAQKCAVIAGTFLAICDVRATSRGYPQRARWGWSAPPSGIRCWRPGLNCAMADTPPIACTLSAADLEDRGGAWRKLMSSGLVERDVVPGGIRLRPAPGAGAALIDLINLARECFAWIRFDVGDGSVVTLTAGGDGGAVLAQMFR